MSFIVRARAKPERDLPEWARCCAEGVAMKLELGEFDLDLGYLNTSISGECLFCDAPAPTHKVARALSGPARGYDVAIEWLDLEEGGGNTHGQ